MERDGGRYRAVEHSGSSMLPGKVDGGMQGRSVSSARDELVDASWVNMAPPPERIAAERLLYVHVLVPNATLTAQLAQVMDWCCWRCQ